MRTQGLELLSNTIQPLSQRRQIPLRVGFSALLDFNLLFRQRRLLGKTLPTAIGGLGRFLCFSKRLIDPSHLFSLPSQGGLNGG